MNELHVDNGSEYSIVIIKDDKHHKYKKNPKRLRTGKDNVKRSISPSINVNQRLNNAQDRNRATSNQERQRNNLVNRTQLGSDYGLDNFLVPDSDNAVDITNNHQILLNHQKPPIGRSIRRTQANNLSFNAEQSR